MLWVAHAAKNARLRPSEWLKMTDEVIADDFDLACAYLIETNKNEREKNRREWLENLLIGKTTDNNTTGPVRGNITSDTVRW